MKNEIARIRSPWTICRSKSFAPSQARCALAKKAFPKALVEMGSLSSTSRGVEPSVAFGKKRFGPSGPTRVGIEIISISRGRA